MGWFGKIVGGGVGALIGGPAGAAVGFGLGTLFDRATSEGAHGFDEGLLAGSQANTLADETGIQIVVQATTALPDSALCAIIFLSENEQPLSPSRRSGDRFRTNDGSTGHRRRGEWQHDLGLPTKWGRSVAGLHEDLRSRPTRRNAQRSCCGWARADTVPHGSARAASLVPGRADRATRSAGNARRTRGWRAAS